VFMDLCSFDVADLTTPNPWRDTILEMQGPFLGRPEFVKSYQRAHR
jgi:hypothetical protein